MFSKLKDKIFKCNINSRKWRRRQSLLYFKEIKKTILKEMAKPHECNIRMDIHSYREYVAIRLFCYKYNRYFIRIYKCIGCDKYYTFYWDYDNGYDIPR